MNKKKCKLIIIGCLLIAMIVTGCSNNQLSDEQLANGKTGTIVLNLTLPGQETTVQSVSSQTSIDTIKVNLIDLTTNTPVQVDPIDVSQGMVPVTIPGLKPGEYTIEIIATENNADGNDYNIYTSGVKNTSVAIDATTTLNIKMKFNTGSLKIEASNSSSMSIETIDISLHNSVLGDKQAKTITLSTTDPSVTFSDLESTNWQAKAVFYDSTGNTLDTWEDNILILPDRENSFTLNIADGSISIDTSWQDAPAAPQYLQLTQSKDGVDIYWDDSYHAYTYDIYRSNSQYGAKTKINSGQTWRNYTDIDVTAGTTYWYWIQALDQDGIASDYSAGRQITILDTGNFTTPLDTCISVLEAFSETSDNSPMLSATTMSSDGSGELRVVYDYDYTETYNTVDEFFYGDESSKTGFLENLQVSSINSITYNNYTIYQYGNNSVEMDIGLDIEYVDSTGTNYYTSEYIEINYENINGTWYIKEIQL